MATNGLGSRPGNVTRHIRELEPGNPPKMSKGHRRLYRLWLLSLVTEDGSPKYPAAGEAVNRQKA